MMTGKVSATIERYHMLTDGCHVTVAVSGGADSIAMLHILHRMSTMPIPGGPRFTLSAAHLNHGIRGDEAKRDEAFVRRICQQWGVELTVGHADIPSLSRQTGEGVEECARRVRYEFLRRCAGDGRIATAHTQNDNVETFLMHMLRGSALRGLGGIPPVRDGIVRPLLNCTRQEVEEYCRQAGLSYVTDSTNLLDDCYRNRIRHRLIPVLESLEPGAVGRIGRMMERLRQDEECLSALSRQTQNEMGRAHGAAGESLSLPTDALLALPRALRSRVLLSFAQAVCTGRLESRHIDAIEDLLSSGGAYTLPNGARVVCRDGRLFPEPSPPASAPPDWQLWLTQGEMALPIGRYRFTMVSQDAAQEGAKIYNLLLNQCIDYDKITGKVAVRTRRPGDGIALPRRPYKSLKKLFNESKLPLSERGSRLILADEAGVLFVEGFGPDRRCAPDCHTQRLLCIEKQEDAHA